MHFLIVGAGGVGGYFGGRLVQKGEQVTFLVRPKRQEQLKQTGLVIRSAHGDWSGPVDTCTYGDSIEPVDVVILATKQYHFDEMLNGLDPYIGPSTFIVPLLNGYLHYERLHEKFGRERVLGGLCAIETTLDENGAILQTSPMHNMILGEWDGLPNDRVQRVYERLQGAGFQVKLSVQIQTEIWNKFIFITCMSGVTTLARSPIGPIVNNPEGRRLFERLLNEALSVARAYHAPLADDIAERILKMTLALPPQMKSSMQRDMEKGLSVEADELQGAFLRMAASVGIDPAQLPVMEAVYANLSVYEETR